MDWIALQLCFVSFGAWMDEASCLVASQIFLSVLIFSERREERSMVVASLEILVVFHRLSRDIGLFKPQQDLPSCCWTSSGRESVMEQKPT